MFLGCGARTIHAWALVASLLAGVAGCLSQDATDRDEVVAVVDGTPITQHEVDAALGPQLRDLERSRYQIRLQQLRRLIAQRVLGAERTEREGDNAFTAALAEATVEVRLPVPDPGEQDGESAGAAEPIDDGSEVTAKRSALPVTLVGTIVRDDPAKSMAALRLPGALLARNVQAGQPIIEGAVLLRVERNRILLRNRGTLEFVPLSVSSEPSTPTPARTLARVTRVPDRVLSLRRGDVERALRDTTALEQSLTRADPELDGRRLLVLGNVEAGSLYDLLQLQERDVLMQVNGEWVDDRRNPLWDALRADGTVTLLVMRAGQPQSFAYEIN